MCDVGAFCCFVVEVHQKEATNEDLHGGCGPPFSIRQFLSKRQSPMPGKQRRREAQHAKVPKLPGPVCCVKKVMPLLVKLRTSGVEDRQPEHMIAHRVCLVSNFSLRWLELL